MTIEHLRYKIYLKEPAQGDFDQILKMNTHTHVTTSEAVISRATKWHPIEDEEHKDEKNDKEHKVFISRIVLYVLLKKKIHTYR